MGLLVLVQNLNAPHFSCQKSINVHHVWSTLVGSMVMEGSRTSDAALDMDGPGLKVENGLGLRSLPDDFAFLEVRAGERGLEKNPTYFFSMSGVLHASRR